MKYKIIDRPVYAPEHHYYSSIETVVSKLRKEDAVISMYRMGNISDPGISDVDLLIILKNGELLEYDPRIVLDKVGKYLFTHQLFAIPESLVYDAMNNTMYHNFELLFGDDKFSNYFQQSLDKEIQRQIAFEYLLKLFISLTIQRSLKIIKQRSFLLEAKAVKFDLEILPNISHLLETQVSKVISLRKNWFKQRISDNEFVLLFESFYNQLFHVMEELARNEMLFTGVDSNPLQVGKNIILQYGKRFGFEQRMSVFRYFRPLVPNRLIRKYTGLLNRTSKYFFYLPLSLCVSNINIKGKFEYEKMSVQYSKKFAPFCIPLKSPLTLF